MVRLRINRGFGGRSGGRVGLPRIGWMGSRGLLGSTVGRCGLKDQLMVMCLMIRLF